MKPSLCQTSLIENWTDVIASPGDLFAQLKSSPVSKLNWFMPLLLTTALSALFCCEKINDEAALEKLNVLGVIALSNAAGLCWSALLLWLIGRVIFKAPFPFLKAMEVVGLAMVILALNLVVTHLLVAATGNEYARPALSLFIEKFDRSNRFHVVLGTLNLLHFWLAGVLSMGLARLCEVRFGEAAFWVFGYWIGLRVVLALLGAGEVVL